MKNQRFYALQPVPAKLSSYIVPNFNEKKYMDMNKG